MTREKDFLTFMVVRFKISRMSSSSTDLLNDERNLVRTRHLQRYKRGNCNMNFTAIQRDGEKQTTTQELSHALKGTKSIVEKLILINSNMPAQFVCR